MAILDAAGSILLDPGGVTNCEGERMGSSSPTSSVLIASLRRPESLRRCVRSLARQDQPPDEVVIVWQGDDTSTRDAAESLRDESPFPIAVVHCREVGIVAAENRALEVASGRIVLLTDDDVVVPRDWVERHLAYYQDPRVGAVGGPYRNIRPDGTSQPERTAGPVARMTWYGRVHGNMYDHPIGWRRRAPRDVDHLAAGNMSLRRSAFDGFEARLRPYWRMFELEACLRLKALGFRVVFDFANVVDHHFSDTPGNLPGRLGDLQTKVYNAAYNRAFALANHSPWYLRPWRLLYLAAVSTAEAPGPLGFPLALKRHGNPRREAAIVGNVWRHRREGWRAGTKARRDRDTRGVPGIRTPDRPSIPVALF